MKSLFTIATVALFTFSTLSGFAKYEREITPTDVKVEKVGDNLNISFGVDVGKHATKRNYRHTIVPIIYKGTTNEKELPTVVIESKRMRWIAEREVISNGKRAQMPHSESIKTSNGEKVRYTSTIPFEKWMLGSSLRFDHFSDGCCSGGMVGTQDLASNLVPYMDIVPAVERTAKVNSTPGEKDKKWNFKKGYVEVQFKLASTTIEEDFSDNRSALREITEAVKSIESSPGQTFSRVEIVGSASPDGAVAKNKKLGEGRAVALKQFLLEQSPTMPESIIEIQNNKENWGELKNMVEESNMKYRNEVLDILNNAPQGLVKKRLMDLRGGRPYNYMLANFFPALRNASYISLYYNTPEIEGQSAETINKGLALVNQRKYSEALPILLTSKNDPRSWNGIGVCYMMMGEFGQAKPYLERSAQAGNDMAKENLKQLRTLEQK